MEGLSGRRVIVRISVVDPRDHGDDRKSQQPLPSITERAALLHMDSLGEKMQIQNTKHSVY